MNKLKNCAVKSDNPSSNIFHQWEFPIEKLKLGELLDSVDSFIAFRFVTKSNIS